MMADAALAQFSLIKDIRAGKQCQTWATWLARHKSRYNITAAKHKRAPPPLSPLHPSHGHNFQRLESCSCSRSWLLMHLVAAVLALTVFALWRASTTKRHTPPHTHKQKQYKFILPRLLRATALGHSLGAQPAAQNLSTARKFRIRSKLALRAIKAGRGGRG